MSWSLGKPNGGSSDLRSWDRRSPGRSQGGWELRRCEMPSPTWLKSLSSAGALSVVVVLFRLLQVPGALL
jgi:hypothetical protein